MSQRVSTEDTWSTPLSSSTSRRSSNLTANVKEAQSLVGMRLKEMIAMRDRLEMALRESEEERLEWLERHFSQVGEMDKQLQELSRWIGNRLVGLEAFLSQVDQRISPRFHEGQLDLEMEPIDVISLINEQYKTLPELKGARRKTSPRMESEPELDYSAGGWEELEEVRGEATKLCSKAKQLQAGVDALSAITGPLVIRQQARKLQEREESRQARLESLLAGLEGLSKLIEQERDYEQAAHVLLGLLQLAASIGRRVSALGSACESAKDFLLADYRRTIGPRGHTPEADRHRLAVGCLLVEVLDEAKADFARSSSSESTKTTSLNGKQALQTKLVSLATERLLSDYTAVFGAGEGMDSLARRLRYFHRLLAIYRVHLWPIFPTAWQVRTMLTIHWAALTGKALVEEAPLATVQPATVIEAWRLSREWEQEMKVELAEEEPTSCTFLSPLLEPILIERVIRPWERDWQSQSQLQPQRPQDWSAVEEGLRSNRNWPRPILHSAISLEADLNGKLRQLFSDRSKISPRLQQEMSMTMSRCFGSYARQLSSECMPPEKSIRKRFSSGILDNNVTDQQRGVLLWIIACLNTLSFLLDSLGKRPTSTDCQQLLVAQTVIFNALLQALQVSVEPCLRRIKKKQSDWASMLLQAANSFNQLLSEHGYPKHITAWRDKLSETIPLWLEQAIWQLKPLSPLQVEPLLVEVQAIREFLSSTGLLNARVIGPLKAVLLPLDPAIHFIEGIRLLIPEADEACIRRILELRGSVDRLSMMMAAAR